MLRRKKKDKKVLIVEDDTLLSRILSVALVAEGLEIATVENGLKVVEKAKKFSPDIILLDLIIPGIDGFAVLKLLKSDKLTKKIPVAILSNLDSAGDIKSGKALGADEYFVKADIEIEKVVNYVKSKLKI